ncbi:MAG: sn-glycerol-3-phosphate ABC transporter ATP-binding protein UgpC [Deltaproteobacteria bacterium]|nr:sn-glycerol-3-phosphate ABC transporter ATP-binding protein UgpC [Deltaproteobacteria bacterium]
MDGVRVADLVKTFGGRPVLDRVSCAAAAGGFLILLGPSGCGKSTLLRIIAGLESQDAGQVFIGEQEVSHLDPRERDVAMVFQSYALYPHLSVADNLAFGLRVRGAPKAEIAARVNEAARLLGLEELLARRPRQLSGGQRQRVAMGRAMVREPRLFLFDEPLSNLDARLRGEMRLELIRLHRRLGTTTVYVTHDQVEAMTLGDRVVILAQGRVQQDGAPQEVYDRPANEFVAGFIGSPPMNLWAGEVSHTGESPLFRSREGLELALPPRYANLPPGPATLGVRPEHLRPGPGAWRARVELVERLGGEAVLYLAAGGTSLTAAVPAGTLPTPGEELDLTPEPTRLHLFREGQRWEPED